MNPAEFPNIAAAEAGFWWFDGMNRMLWNLLGDTPSGRHSALEVGCGTGAVSEQYQRRYPDSRIVSMDLAPEGLSFSRSRGLQLLVEADMRRLPFSSARFDTVLALDVIAHLEPGEEHGAFEELARVLAPGGVLLIRCSAFDALRSRHSAFVNERQRFRARTLLPALERTGLVPIRHTYANCLLLPVAFLKFRLWEPFTKAPVESGLRPVAPSLNAMLRAVLMLEAAWIARGRRFPAGQSLWVLARKEQPAA